MTNDGEHRDRQSVDAFLDGLLSADEVRALKERLGENRFADIVQQQSAIDASLQRLFEVDPVSPDQVKRILGEDDSEQSPSGPASTRHARPLTDNRRRFIGMLAMAGLVAWLMVVFQFRADDPGEPMFVSRPLVSIYQEAIEQGFEPYYECREPERFAYTFEQRQGIAVDLATMPKGSGMLGLSYSGGLSRETTVMLCTVDDQPVMVFVDLVAKDTSTPSITAAASGVQVFREERDGLVMYEVTPFDEPRAAPYLRPRR